MKNITIDMNKIKESFTGPTKELISILNKYVEGLNRNPLENNNSCFIEHAYEIYGLVDYWESRFFEEIQDKFGDVVLLPGYESIERNLILQALRSFNDDTERKISEMYMKWAIRKANDDNEILQVYITNGWDTNGTPQLYFKSKYLTNIENFINDIIENRKPWEEKKVEEKKMEVKLTNVEPKREYKHILIRTDYIDRLGVEIDNVLKLLSNGGHTIVSSNMVHNSIGKSYVTLIIYY